MLNGGDGRESGPRRREVTDLYFDWARLREVAEDGAILVRPDKHVGWRSMRLPEDPERALYAAMSSLLGREASLAGRDGEKAD